MSNIKCYIIQDLMPLYIDGLVSEKSKDDIEEHIKTCKECEEYLKIIKEDPIIDIDMKIDDKDLEGSGEKIVNKIKTSQNRLKYTFIIFSIVVAVVNSLTSGGILSTIPLVIIIPTILRLFFDESKLIITIAITAHIGVSLATYGLGYGLFIMPVMIICVVAGLSLGSVIKMFINRRG